MVLLLFLGGVSGYSFNLIARVGDEVGADTYKDTWAKLLVASIWRLGAVILWFLKGP